MQSKLETERLTLNKIHTGYARFILALVNTPGWIRFIGDRKVRTWEDAMAYTRYMELSTTGQCLVITRKDQEVPIGIISFIQRDYLSFPDIGFALLPEHERQGFAFEAAWVVLCDAMDNYPLVYASVLADNVGSIQLIEKLGLRYEKEIEVEDEVLLLYSITQEQFLNRK